MKYQLIQWTMIQFHTVINLIKSETFLSKWISHFLKICFSPGNPFCELFFRFLWLEDIMSLIRNAMNHLRSAEFLFLCSLKLYSVAFWLNLSRLWSSFLYAYLLYKIQTSDFFEVIYWQISDIDAIVTLLMLGSVSLTEYL